MDVIVQKFGGTSVATPAHMQRCAERVQRTVKDGTPVIVVVSAMGGVTNRLLGLAHDVAAMPDRRELDRILVTGEQVAAAMIALALQQRGLHAVSLDPRETGITAEPTIFAARITGADPTRLRAMLEAGQVPVVPGYQAMSADGNVVTIGRGGSDTTAAVLAGAWRQSYGESLCEINTDVVGVHTADPNIVPGSRRLDWITHEAMTQLAFAGAQVVNPHAVEYAAKTGVTMMVRHAHLAGAGTWVRAERDVEDATLSGWMPLPVITLARDVVQWTLMCGADGRDGSGGGGTGGTGGTGGGERVIAALDAALDRRGIHPLVMTMAQDDARSRCVRLVCREREAAGVAQAIAEAVPDVGPRDVTMGPSVAALTVHTPRARTTAHDDSIDRAYQQHWMTARATFTSSRSRTDLIDPVHAEDAVRMVHDSVVGNGSTNAKPASEIVTSKSATASRQQA
jgi:aspartate kinase